MKRGSLAGTRLAAFTGIAAMLGALACGGEEEAQEEDGGYFGRWAVIGFEMPGFHALSAEESQSWMGAEAFYSDGEARFGAQRCGPPAYAERTLAAEELGSAYRVDPALLGIAEPVRVIEIGCAAEWAGPGAVLILRADGTALTAWEGVFFELGRAGS